MDAAADNSDHDVEAADSTAMTKISAGHNMLELQAIESEVEITRDLSTEHPDVTRKELWGWYLFEFASQPYSSAVLTTFLPLVLEDLAWRAGTSDPTNPLHPPCADRSQLSTDQVRDAVCHTAFGGGWISPVSFSLYVQSISVGLQVIAFISCGAIADYSRWRKVLMLAFSSVTALTCIGYLLVLTPEFYMLAAVLTIVGNIAYGTSMVFYNAYLPILVDAHPRVRKLKAEIETRLSEIDLKLGGTDGTVTPQSIADKQESDDAIETRILTASQLSLSDARAAALNELHDERDRVANEASTHGFGMGYTSAVLLLLFLAGLMFGIGSDATYIMQICIAIVGVWHLCFLWGFAAPWLRTRPGPALPAAERRWGFLSYFVFSWKKTWKTVMRCAQLKGTFMFLISWFFYSDGYSTIASVAILFGKSTLNMTSSQLVIIAVATPFVAIAGNYFFLHVCHKRLAMSSKNIVIMLLGLVCLIPIYGLVGFLVPDGVSVGFKSVPEMYVVAVYYGFMLGALQSFSRVLFAELLPPGMESEFFALYEITDRGSSWLGPLLVAVCTEAFGNIRYGFFMLLLLLAFSLPPLFALDTAKAKKAARSFSLATEQ